MSKIFTSWIETLLRHRTVQIELHGDKVKREVVKGNPQGGIQSSFPWNCVLNSLLLELRSRGFYVQAYADDLAVLVTGADMLWIRGMAQKAINIAANWALEQELQFSSKKTEIVLFTHKRNPDLGSLSMNGTKLKLSKEARLLGVTLDSKLAWKPHITRITRKEITALMQCRQIVGKNVGNNTIYDEMDIHSYDTSNHVVCMCVLGWRSQQKVSSEETHKGAETCLPDDFISFLWHLYWCSGNFAQRNSH